MRSGSAPAAQRRVQRGLGYLLVLFALAAMGLLLAGAGQVWQTVQQREKEAELLFIGEQFRLALGSYYRVSPQGSPREPQRLEELLEDRRFVTPRRHLRKLYRDPMSGQAEWGLTQVGGRITGVHSLSRGQALKRYLPGGSAVEGPVRYEQWIFSRAPDTADTVPVARPSSP